MNILSEWADSFVSDHHAVGLLCYCWSYTSKFQLKKRKKVTYYGRNDVVLVFAHGCTSLSHPDTLSPILTRTICRLAATVFKVSCGEKKVTYFGRNDACT